MSITITDPNILAQLAGKDVVEFTDQSGRPIGRFVAKHYLAEYEKQMAELQASLRSAPKHGEKLEPQ